MEYVLKASAVILIFYVCYKLFLQRETFFEHNRWFLLIGLITAFLVPFIIIPKYVEATPLDLSSYVFNTPIATENTEKPFSILDYLPIIYGLGVAVFTIRVLIQFAALVVVIFKNKGEKIGCFTYIKTTNNLSPFSFFNWIVYNPDKFSELELNHIITHEKVHANQMHSFDILLAHIACILLWFNPIIWLYNKALKQNLEFIADKETAKLTHCKKSYQYTLLKTSMPSHQMALSTNFYNSLIKKRIVMLHKSKSKKINQLKYALIIPVLGLFLMSFNTKEVYVEKPILNNTNNESKDSFKINKTAIITKDNTDSELEQVKNRLAKNHITLTYSNLVRNSINEIIKIYISVKNDNSKASATWGNDQKPIPNIEVGEVKKGHLIARSVVKQVSKNNKLIDDSYLNLNKLETHIINQDDYKVIITKDLSDADFKRIIVEASKMGVTLNFDNIKRNNKNEIISIDAKFKNDKGSGTSNQKSTNPIFSFSYRQNNDSFGFYTELETATIIEKSLADVKVTGFQNTQDGKNPLIIVDGKEINNDEINNINPNTIEKIDILKGDNATKVYGIKGKDGVVLITIKKEKESEWQVSEERNTNVIFANKDTIYVVGKPNVFKNYSKNFDKQPLYILDGKEIDPKQVASLDGFNIESVSTIKDSKYAVEKYGEKAKNGVVEIKTRTANSKTPIIKVVGTALYIVDGKEMKKKDFDLLKPENIDSINVFKGDMAIKKYGAKGKNGVIEIITKKKE